MNNQLLDRIRPIFAGILQPEQLDALDMDSTMDNTEGWDSLNFLEIILGLETEFGFRIDGLDAANMVSIANIIDYIEAHAQVDDHA